MTITAKSVKNKSWTFRCVFGEGWKVEVCGSVFVKLCSTCQFNYGFQLYTCCQRSGVWWVFYMFRFCRWELFFPLTAGLSDWTKALKTKTNTVEGGIQGRGRVGRVYCNCQGVWLLSLTCVNYPSVKIETDKHTRGHLPHKNPVN